MLTLGKFAGIDFVGSCGLRHRCWLGDFGFDSQTCQIGQCRQRLATAAMFLRSCVAQALDCEDEPRYSSHASAQHHEYNEDLMIWFGSMLAVQGLLLLYYIINHDKTCKQACRS